MVVDVENREELAYPDKKFPVADVHISLLEPPTHALDRLTSHERSLSGHPAPLLHQILEARLLASRPLNLDAVLVNEKEVAIDESGIGVALQCLHGLCD